MQNHDKEIAGKSNSKFTPPFPDPRGKRPSLFERLKLTRKSWLAVFFTKSYRMKTGFFRIPGKRFFIINQPNLVREILINNAEKYPKSTVLHSMLNLLIGDGIFISNGKTWKRQREMMEQAMTASHIRHVFPLMQQATLDFLKTLKEKKESKKNISQEMAYITADIIFRTIFSKPLTIKESEIIFNSFSEYQRKIAKISPLLFMGIPSKLFQGSVGIPAKKIREVIKNKIKPRMNEFQGNSGKYNDILEGLLSAQDEHGNHFTLEELVDQVATIFLAGHETTATTLTWSFYLLAKCPDLQNSIRTEIKNNKSNPNTLSIEYEDIRKLKSTAEVFKETLRLYPPVGGFMRQSNTQACMRDKKIEKGDGISILPWLLHRREDIWPNTHDFDPGRFNDPEQKACIKDYYFPYSAGQRVCIGASFANQEAILILATLVQHFSFKPVEGNNPMPVGHITIKPEQSVQLMLEELT